jgi:hypothetical protein
MRPPKPNSVEPPWYGTRMPGGVGGVASRGVPPIPINVLYVAVRPDGADHLWGKVPLRELSMV